MAATKTIKLIKPWHLHPAGQVLTVDAPVADLLIESGRAEEIKPESADRKSNKKK